MAAMAYLAAAQTFLSLMSQTASNSADAKAAEKKQKSQIKLAGSASRDIAGMIGAERDQLGGVLKKALAMASVRSVESGFGGKLKGRLKADAYRKIGKGLASVRAKEERLYDNLNANLANKTVEASAAIQVANAKSNIAVLDTGLELAKIYSGERIKIKQADATAAEMESDQATATTFNTKVSDIRGSADVDASTRALVREN